MKHKFTVSLIILSLVLMTTTALAGDDPNIKGHLRENIGKAMMEFISTNTMNGQFVVYDAVEGKLLKLELEKLHAGIVKKGDYYVSCADFFDKDGRKIDIDFLVIEGGGHYSTLEAIVHKIDGEKRKYHLEK